jgi:hypothetical protein
MPLQSQVFVRESRRVDQVPRSLVDRGQKEWASYLIAICASVQADLHVSICILQGLTFAGSVSAKYLSSNCRTLRSQLHNDVLPYPVDLIPGT